MFGAGGGGGAADTAAMRPEKAAIFKADFMMPVVFSPQLTMSDMSKNTGEGGLRADKNGHSYTQGAEIAFLAGSVYTSLLRSRCTPPSAPAAISLHDGLHLLI